MLVSEKKRVGIGEEAITFIMLYNMLSNEGFHSIACNAGETNRYIVAGQASRSLFVY